MNMWIFGCIILIILIAVTIYLILPKEEIGLRYEVFQCLAIEEPAGRTCAWPVGCSYWDERASCIERLAIESNDSRVCNEIVNLASDKTYDNQLYDLDKESFYTRIWKRCKDNVR